jgi:hypothetical protein
LYCIGIHVKSLFGYDCLQLFEQTYHVSTQVERNCGKATKQRLVGSDRLSVPREEATRKEETLYGSKYKP